ncbi:hypothetical protein BDK51DRAFT_35259 [Blyttiomyces helicus]|uniref:Uncharacterized protein n=1 Tax=Blyttiomyces helicus TaxID=388810 RepID=A0A4P9W1D8_9FUNG|nr:hypothetical protein BDK51DRAFT_35259 [Blyttiomyces helicus]|eukprot:RKO83886.1 hypothetical protein BDK51DRAFT_35259 [Blyttiomyces helicus]
MAPHDHQPNSPDRRPPEEGGMASLTPARISRQGDASTPLAPLAGVGGQHRGGRHTPVRVQDSVGDTPAADTAICRQTSKRDRSILLSAMAELMGKGAAEEISNVPPHAIGSSPTFVIKQKGGKIRQIGDYSGLNERVSVPRFKMETLASVKAMMAQAKREPECSPQPAQTPMDNPGWRGEDVADKSVVLWIDKVIWTGGTDDECLISMLFGTQLVQLLGFLLKWEKAELPYREVCRVDLESPGREDFPA